MTGEHRDALACQVGQGPFDSRRQLWQHPRHWSWRCYGVQREQLQELVRPADALGEVTSAASMHTGIPEGVPVISGGSDKACEVLGSGCLEVDEACVGLGTTATINVDSARYLEPVRFVPAFPSAQPGRYNLEHMVFRGFWMVTWFREQFAHDEAERAGRAGVAVEDMLEQLASEVPAGCRGLMMQPTWSPGIVIPGAEAKGVMLGFGGVHGKADMYRAILEGLAYAMREGRDRVVARSGRRLRRLAVCGGGSQSDLMMQIMADVFGMPACRARYYEASALGAAILATVGLGWHADVPSAAREMTRDGQAFQPHPERTRLYDQLYDDVYQPLYNRLKPVYTRLMDITGYPEPPTLR